MNNNRKKVLTMAGIAILIALEVVIFFVQGFIKLGTLTLNLAIIPIAIAACLYGPIGGLALGLINGALVLADPGTAAFYAINVFGTIVVCLLKTGLAGLAAGYLFKGLSKLNYKGNLLVASIGASIVVPLINTFLFSIGFMIWFNTENIAYNALIIGLVGINFLVEFLTIVVLSPTIAQIVRIISNKMGSSNK